MRLGLGLGMFLPTAILSGGGGPPPDVTAPTLSSPTGTQTGQTTANLGVTTNEDNGTLYSFVSTSATPPTAANLKAGTGAVFANSQTITTTGAKTAAATGLTAATAYYVHWLHRDAAGNDSAIATSASFTTAAASGTGVPNDYSGLQWYWDPSNAASRTPDVGVGGLSDLSGNARHLSEATGANQPAVNAAVKNGRDALLYDLTDRLSAADYPTNTLCDIYVVAQNISSTSNRHLVRKGAGNTPFVIRFTSATQAQGYIRNSSGTISSVITITVPTGWCILRLWWDGTTVYFSCNGGAPGTAALAGTAMWDGTDVLCYGWGSDTGSPQTVASNIGPAFCYSEPKSAPDAAALIAKLNTDWAVF